MKASKEVYIVIECGGEYEDRWQTILGVFSTKELAETFKKEYKSNREKDLINEELYNEFVKEINDIWDTLSEEDQNKTYCELIHERHPEYSIEQIDKSESYYEEWWNIGELYIDKINYYG